MFHLRLTKKKRPYDLVAILKHRGKSVKSGHYFCYIKHGEDGWFIHDDQVIAKRQWKKIRKDPNCVFLVYKLIPQPLGNSV